MPNYRLKNEPVCQTGLYNPVENYKKCILFQSESYLINV